MLGSQLGGWGVGGGDRTGEMGSGVLGLTGSCLPVEDKLGEVPPSWKVVGDLPGPPRL